MSTRDCMAKRLHEFRRNSGYSVEEVGRRIGKSGKTVSAWEVGRGQPNADTLVQLCILYNVRIADFYDEETIGASPEEEVSLICLFRKMTPETKKLVLSLFEALLGSNNR